VEAKQPTGEPKMTWLDPKTVCWVKEESERLKWSMSFFIAEKLREAMAREVRDDE